MEDEQDDNDIRAAGQVLEIELENFMCHKNLRMTFNTKKYNCAYIVGPNGSGKSAVFAGLNIGLGGKGKSNDRGNALSAYIKEGETIAKIRVHLANVGDNRHPDYDDEIVIERTIRQSSSTYLIKSRNRGRDRTVSTSKKDLDVVLRRFCIELENPLCWLSQDRARQFLNEMKPEKLYEIFMITSELCLVNLHHNTTAEQLEDMKTILAKWQEKQSDMKERYEKLVELEKKLAKLKKVRSNISKANWLMLWIPLKSNKTQRSEIERAILENSAKSEEITRRLANRSVESEDLRRTVTENRSKLDALNQEISEITMNRRRQQQEVSNAHVDLKQCVAVEAQIKSKLRQCDEELQRANQTLESILGRADRNIAGEKGSFLEKIQEIRQEIAAEKNKKNDFEQLQASVDAVRQQNMIRAREAFDNIKMIESRIEQINKDRIDQARIAEDKMARFGEYTTRILRAIESDHHFHHTPIGPIGNFIKVKDPKWAPAIENLLRSHLNGFICNDAQDRRVFENLLRQSRYHVSNVVTARFSHEKINTSSRAPHNSIMTLDRMLEVDNATVYNYLIDATRMESIMLIENDNNAREIMSRNPPPNITKAATLRGADVHPASNDKPYRFYAGPQQLRLRILTDQENVAVEEDHDRLVAEQQEQIVVHQEKWKKWKAKAEESTSELEDVRHQIDVINIAVGRKERDIHKLEEELVKLDRIKTREVLTNNAKKVLNEVLKQKANTEKQHDETLQRKEALLEAKKAKEAEVERLNGNVQQLSASLLLVEQETEQFRLELQNFDVKTEEMQSELRSNEKMAKRFVSKKKELDAEETNLIKNLGRKEEFEQPEGYSDPPDYDTLPDEEYLNDELQKLERRKKDLKVQTRNQQVTPGDLKKAKKEYEAACKSVDEFNAKMEKVKLAFCNREELFERVKKEVPVKLRAKFQEFMAMRNYAGDLKVDHENKRIDISAETHKRKDVFNEDDDDDEYDELLSQKHNTSKVATNRRRTKAVVQDLKGLSGGERSYTTACFVMALWSCIESPFRCLDEFDVFMDMVNRRVVMELLSEFARTNRFIQFFFFTPQGISELNANDMEVFEVRKQRI